ncbi:MAG: NAD(P)H-dependent oxidoreductase subunit E [Desulfomicrobium escambiense]|nr:NAD(P)H-dependent oxidoreductase subunit E [Desulfomicrobium escambiense]
MEDAMPEAEVICQEPEVDFFTLIDRIIRDEFDGREAMIMMMQAIQRHYHFLPGARSAVPLPGHQSPADQDLTRWRPSTPRFSLVPKGKHHRCSVCTGTACHVKGSGGVVRARSPTQARHRARARPRRTGSSPSRPWPAWAPARVAPVVRHQRRVPSPRQTVDAAQRAASRRSMPNSGEPS